MNARVQQALDGDIGRDTLTVTEQAELAATEAALGAVVRAIPVEPLPELSSAILQHIRSRGAPGPAPAPVPAKHPGRGIAEWLWRPRPVSIGWRPAYALAAAVVLAVVITANALRPGRAVLPGTQQVLTQFVLRAPDAKYVALAGDFTGWQPAFTMTRTEPGVWTVVVPLDPGIHQYSFVVDGERWIPDPAAPAVNDGFGGMNSRIAVLTPDARRL
jgi:hypothetical protein